MIIIEIHGLSQGTSESLGENVMNKIRTMKKDLATKCLVEYCHNTVKNYENEDRAYVRVFMTSDESDENTIKHSIRAVKKNIAIFICPIQTCYAAE